MKKNHLKFKLLVILLGLFLLVTVILLYYSMVTSKNYRSILMTSIRQTVAYESEHVANVMAEMERNAIDLALSGKHYYNAKLNSHQFGVDIVVDNFRYFKNAVGGGIWYEPYLFDPQQEHNCFYAYYNSVIDDVIYSPKYESEEYDYPNQMWYQTIKQQSKEAFSPVWTIPYFDDNETNVLMTTVGAGIYIDQKFIGMATVDWNMHDLLERLKNLKPTPHSHVSLISYQDNYVISTTLAAEISSVEDIPWYKDFQYQQNVMQIIEVQYNGQKNYCFIWTFPNGWLFVVRMPESEIFAEMVLRNKLFSLAIITTFLVFLILASFILTKQITNPLQKLTAAVVKFGEGDLTKRIQINSQDELAVLASAFNQMAIDLVRTMEENLRERAENERIGTELGIAREIQACMLPCIFPPYPERKEFDIYGSMHPAKEVGGDFYDFFFIDDDTLAIVIGDVSETGVPAALFMVITKTLIKNSSQQGKSPQEVLEAVNKILYESNNNDMFVTVFMGFLKISSGTFTYVSAGHNPQLVNFGHGFEWINTKSNLVLAAEESSRYQQYEITLRPGNMLVLYTDGVTEANNIHHELFGKQRLLEKVNTYSHLPLQEINKKIYQDLNLYSDGLEQFDDITLLILRIY